MSVQALSWVLEHSQARLGPRLVLIALANQACAHGSNAWPRILRLARDSRLSERQTTRAISNLVQLRELVILDTAAPESRRLYVIYPLWVASGGDKLSPSLCLKCHQGGDNSGRAIRNTRSLPVKKQNPPRARDDAARGELATPQELADFYARLKDTLRGANRL